VVQLPAATETSYCTVCCDQSASGVDDDVTVGRKSTAKYACADCGGDRMCVECARAHRKQRLSRDHELVELSGRVESVGGARTLCVEHPLQPVTAYCSDCGSGVCGRCGPVAGGGVELDDGAGRCRHSAVCDATTAARSGRAHLLQHQQVHAGAT